MPTATSHFCNPGQQNPCQKPVPKWLHDLDAVCKLHVACIWTCGLSSC